MHLPSGARGRLLFAVAVAAALLVLLLGATGSALWNAREAARSQAAQALDNLALSLARDVSRSLEAYDVLLRAVAEGTRPAERPLDVIGHNLLAEGAAAGTFGAVVVTDAAGRVVGSSEPLPPGLDLSGTSHFRAHQERADLGLVVGEVERSRVTGRPKVSLSRRVGGPNGGFAGVVAGNVKLEYFAQAFAAFRLGDGGVVTLLSEDGRLLAAAPFRPERIGADLNSTPAVRRLRAEGPGTFEALSAADGRERLYSVRRLAGLPFVLAVGTSTEGIYADWKRRAWATCGALGGFLVLLGAVALALRRELRRRRTAEAAARLAEQDARASAGELRLVTDNLDDVVFKVDWDGRRRYVSPSCERLFGYSQAEAMTRHTFAAIHPEDESRVAGHFAALREGREAGLVAYRVQRRDGAWRHFEAQGRALPDGTGAVIVARDVTARAELEERLRQSQRLEAVGQLTAGVAHDFNNLLQAQMAGLELLLDTVQGQERATRYAEMAIASSEKGAKLTHSLLSFSRQQVLRPEAVELPELLGRLRGLLSRTLGPRIALRFDADTDLPPPLADPAQLEAALLNLCLNARDAMGERGGELLVEVRNGTAVPARSEVAKGLDPARCVVLVVADEGCGMDEATLARVCEPFFTTKGVGQGSGLGLSMVQGFARQSGGELRIQSWPGAGTRVEIWLPQAPSAASRTGAAGRVPHQGKARLAAQGACCWWTTSRRCGSWWRRPWKAWASRWCRPGTARRG